MMSRNRGFTTLGSVVTVILLALLLAGAASLVTLALALFMAYGNRLRPSALSDTCVRVAGMGYAIPGTVIDDTCYAIAPGTIDTPQNREAMPQADHSRWVPPEAIADVILFLASDAARASRIRDRVRRARMSSTNAWCSASDCAAMSGMLMPPCLMTLANTRAVIPGRIETSPGRSNISRTWKVRVLGSAVVANSLTRAGKVRSGIELTLTTGFTRSVICCGDCLGIPPAISRSGTLTSTSSCEISCRMSTGSLACTLAKSSTSLRAT